MKPNLLFCGIALILLTYKSTYSQNSPFSVNSTSGQSVTSLTSGVLGGALLRFQRYGSGNTNNHYAFETGAGNNDDLRLHVNGAWSTPVMSFKTDGKVGIGTIPIQDLHISKSNASTTLLIENTSSSSAYYPGISINNYRGSTTGHPYVTLNNANGTSVAPLAITSNILGAIIFGGHNGTSLLQTARIEAGVESTFNSSSAPTSLVFSTTSTNSTSYSEKLRITSSGSVGIGTATPQQKLHVEGSMYLNTGSFIFNQNQSANTSAKIYFQKSGVYSWDIGTETSDPSNNFILYNRTTSTYPLIINTANNIPTFKTDRIRMEGLASGGGTVNVWDLRCRDLVDNDFGIFNNSQSVYRVYINGSGNMGIGTIHPDQLLTVNGTVHAKEVKVDLNVPGPDYVFEKDYPLTSLEEIKAYIEKNKHLPEVPSAKEMETNGINLSEMNMLLLKKIEELTLHVIQLQQQLKQHLDNKN